MSSDYVAVLLLKTTNYKFKLIFNPIKKLHFGSIYENTANFLKQFFANKFF